MISTEIFLVKGISNYSAELPSEVLFKKFLDIHHRGIIFGAEPLAPLATLCPTDVARVSSWCFPSSAVVLPKTIFEECLRQTDLKESAVGLHLIDVAGVCRARDDATALLVVDGTDIVVAELDTLFFMINA